MKAQWQVIDQDGETVWTPESILAEPCVKGGLFTPREWAKRLAKENTDPEAPAPLQAVKI